MSHTWLSTITEQYPLVGLVAIVEVLLFLLIPIVLFAPIHEAGKYAVAGLFFVTALVIFIAYYNYASKLSPGLTPEVLAKFAELGFFFGKDGKVSYLGRESALMGEQTPKLPLGSQNP